MARRSSIARKDARTESPSDDARWRRQVATVVVAITMAIGSQVPTATAAGLVGTARADSYSVMTGEVLVVPDPGVLDNDTVVAGSAAAELRNDVDHGTLDLDEDGGFRYEPAAGFVGTDRFTYRIPGGLLLLLPSAPATVTITVTDPPPDPDPDAASDAYPGAHGEAHACADPASDAASSDTAPHDRPERDASAAALAESRPIAAARSDGHTVTSPDAAAHTSADQGAELDPRADRPARDAACGRNRRPARAAR